MAFLAPTVSLEFRKTLATHKCELISVTRTISGIILLPPRHPERARGRLRMSVAIIRDGLKRSGGMITTLALPAISIRSSQVRLSTIRGAGEVARPNSIVMSWYKLWRMSRCQPALI